VDKQFELGVVTVSVFTANGECHIEDWDPDDAEKALEYAGETAHCDDVKRVEFYDARGRKRRVFRN